MKKLTHDIKFPIGKGKYDVWIFAICMFFCAMPYFMWQVSSFPFLFICAFLSIKNIDKGKTFFLGIFMILLYLYSGIISDWSLWGILFILLLTPIFFSKPRFIKQSFDVYVYIFSILMIPSLLQYILVNLLGIDMPHTVIKSMNTDKQGEYSRYLFMVTYSGKEIIVDYIFPRFFSYFDEAGMVGTISAVILFVKRFNLKSWVNIPIFIAGIFSFSLVFYLLSFIYLFFLVKTKYKLILIPILMTVFIYFTDNEILKHHIIERLKLDSDFIESFLTRRDSAHFEEWYSNFKKTPQYFTGMGSGYNLSVNPGGSSFKNIITDFGIIFFILYLAAFVLYGIRYLGFSKELFSALLILFSVMYQRPFIQDLSYVFIMFAPFVFFQEEKREVLLKINNERERRIQSRI